MCDFHPGNIPPDVHGLGFYGDGATGRIEAYGLSPDDGSCEVAAMVRTIQQISTSSGIPLNNVAAEGVAVARRCQAPEVAAAFAQAIHLLTDDRIFVIHSNAGWRGASYHDVPFLSSLEEAYAWIEDRISLMKERASQ
jgi:hypothetical protein